MPYLFQHTYEQAAVLPVVGNRPCVHDDLRPTAAELLRVQDARVDLAAADPAGADGPGTLRLLTGSHHCRGRGFSLVLPHYAATKLLLLRLVHTRCHATLLQLSTLTIPSAWRSRFWSRVSRTYATAGPEVR